MNVATIPRIDHPDSRNQQIVLPDGKCLEIYQNVIPEWKDGSYREKIVSQVAMIVDENNEKTPNAGS